MSDLPRELCSLGACLSPPAAGAPSAHLRAPGSPLLWAASQGPPEVRSLRVTVSFLRNLSVETLVCVSARREERLGPRRAARGGVTASPAGAREQRVSPPLPGPSALGSGHGEPLLCGFPLWTSSPQRVSPRAFPCHASTAFENVLVGAGVCFRARRVLRPGVGFWAVGCSSLAFVNTGLQCASAPATPGHRGS